MASSTPLEDRKRKLRNSLLASFIFLIFIWIFKFSHPQFTILPSTSLSGTSPPPSAPTKPSTPHRVLVNGKWKSKTSSSSPSGILLASEVAHNVTLGSKAAVIIQPEFRQNIIPLIVHFAAILGPSWPVLIYTTPESAPSFSSSAALTRYLSPSPFPTIQIRILPQTVLLTNGESLSAFLTNPWLWETLDPAEWVLLFDSDSMLCANAARSVEDYFEYSFVGAPIREGLGKGFNGGLSLRRRSRVLRVLDQWDWEASGKKEGDRFEDQWFYNRLKELKEEDEINALPEDDEKTIRLPSVEVARTFSVETIDYPHPLGVHQVHRFQKEQLGKLDEWCPEYKLCSVPKEAAAPA